MKKDKILKILEKVPLETKLYSTTFGQLKYNGTNYYTDGNQKISLITENDVNIIYLPNGKYKEGGEVTLYPSKDMRDWDKFAWRKGDVLVNSKGIFCIFKEFSGYPYTTFIATLVNNIGIMIGSILEVTQEWHKASSEDAEKYIEYVNTSLKKVDRRLNLETLEVEKTGFKDGDILTCQATPSCGKSIFIFKGETVDGYAYHAAIGTSGILCISSGNTWCGKEDNVEYATEAERMKLFDAIVKANKYWNVEKKIIEDIRPVTKRPKPTYKKESNTPEHKFGPFEKVLVRDTDKCKWKIDIFEREDLTGDDEFKYVCLVSSWKNCIPYKGNEHLLGTTNNPD